MRKTIGNVYRRDELSPNEMFMHQGGSNIYVAQEHDICIFHNGYRLHTPPHEDCIYMGRAIMIDGHLCTMGYIRDPLGVGDPPSHDDESGGFLDEVNEAEAEYSYNVGDLVRYMGDLYRVGGTPENNNGWGVPPGTVVLVGTEGSLHPGSADYRGFYALTDLVLVQSVREDSE